MLFLHDFTALSRHSNIFQLGHSRFMWHAKLNESGPYSETQAFKRVYAVTLRSSPPLCERQQFCITWTASARLPAREIPTAASTVPKGLCWARWQWESIKNQHHMTRNLFSTKVWEHLIRKLQQYLKGRYENTMEERVLPCSTTPGHHCSRRCIYQDGQEALTHKMLLMPLLAKVLKHSNPSTWQVPSNRGWLLFLSCVPCPTFVSYF